MTASENAWRGRRVTVVASFDSFLRAGACYARHFEARGASVRYQLVFARAHQLSLHQREQFGISEDVRTLPLPAVVTPQNLASEDLVILALDGLRSRRFLVRLHRAFAGAKRRPLVLSVYPGVIFRFHLEGMTSRMAADVLALNSPADLELYERALAGMGLKNRNALCLGLSFLPSLKRPLQHTPPANGAIVFAGQPTVPAGRTERLYVVHRLASLARAHPNVRIVLKPRHRRADTTLHRVDHHYEDLLADLARTEQLPDNLVASHEPMDQLVDRAQLLLTFSSTAAVEALARGIPTRILNDLGVHENIGNHFFLGSGLLASFDDVRPGLDYRQEADWRARHLRSAADHLPQLDERLEALFAEQGMARALPPPYSRMIGRSPAFDRFTSEREGWHSVADLGKRGASGWIARLRRATRPVVGLVQQEVARASRRR